MEGSRGVVGEIDVLDRACVCDDEDMHHMIQILLSVRD
jgi:hypothetical protein